MTSIKNIKKITGFTSVLFAISFMFTMPYAEEGYSEGGGTSQCTPPTMGLLSGKSFVENGFTINGQAYDVKHSNQDIPVTSFNVGDKNEIILKVHEDSGSNNVVHVGLGIVTPQEISPKLTEVKSTIEWNKDDPEGVGTVDVFDSNNMLQDVTVDSVVDPEAGLTTLTISFETSEQLDPVALKVTTWDRKLCSWTNTFELVDEQASTDEQTLQEMELSKKLLEKTPLTCGINIISSTSLNYGQLEAGVLSSESQIVIENVGNTDATLFVKATPWKDDLNIAQIAVDNTRFSINEGTDFAYMTPASEYDTKIGSISPNTSLTTFWKVQSDLLNSGFEGSLSQTMEFATSC